MTAAGGTPRAVTVAGAGIIGLWQALTLARAGFHVELLEASAAPFSASSSRWAAAMIAPECEAEAAPASVRDLGRRGLELWRSAYPGLKPNGTLVVANARDRADFERFARMTERRQLLNPQELRKLEPELTGRFDAALYYPAEAHMSAVKALTWILAECQAAGVTIKLNTPWTGGCSGVVIDCRGIAARDALRDLRGVRGERIIVAAPEVRLSRPVRLLHPRQPIYVVPQGNSRYVIGATVIERDDEGPMTVRSALELLGSAFALHPGFAEADIIDFGAGVRPSFADHVPRIASDEGSSIIRVNGAYRHGFLLAPVLAEQVLAVLQSQTAAAAAS